MVDTKKNEIKRIKDFEQIKNPRYLNEYDLVDNEVMSGRNWTAFYKIKANCIKSYEEDEYIVYWGEDENGNPKDPDKEYRIKLNKILELEKNNR